MQVFKACLIILKKNLVSMAIYLGIFLVFVVLITVSYTRSDPSDFTASRPRTALINEDTGNLLSDHLAAYITAHTQLVDIEPDADKLQDALFFRQIVYVVRIPTGFGEAYLEGDSNATLIRTSLPDSFQGTYTDQLIERYLNAISRYRTVSPDRTLDSILADVDEDMAISSTVTLQPGSSQNPFEPMIYYFTFLAYSLIAVMILGVTSLMLSFQSKDMKKRNTASPLPLMKFNLQLLLGNLVFAVIAWLFLSLTSLFLFGGYDNLSGWLLLILNTFIFSLTCLSMSFLISQFIKSRAVQQATANVFALGTCFISGVFVPQEMLGDQVLAVASFTPTYWYIKGVRLIQHFDRIPLNQINSFTQAILIQLGFMLTFAIVALVVAKHRQQSAN